ncbi:hypothetical protein N7452_007130 [Penicillium brevicompactum]|uniref:Uncharacterized protein n=1 Tax=Penicillium brevicompactum TaxID=5074 RepID=A0A9W9QG40_PENBR|nr:hypothetical protein N7452_007130 [Penicillium brevicompactum]
MLVDVGRVWTDIWRIGRPVPNRRISGVTGKSSYVGRLGMGMGLVGDDKASIGMGSERGEGGV